MVNRDINNDEIRKIQALKSIKDSDNKDELEVNLNDSPVFTKLDYENKKTDLEQKKKLFNHLIRLTWSVFVAVMVIIAINGVFAYFSTSKPFISDGALSLVITGMFAEIFGVIAIIAKYLWSK